MHRALLSSTVALLPALAVTGSAFAADAGPGLITDINAQGLDFGNIDAFAGGTYGLDEAASINGNEIAVWTALGPSASDGGGFSVPISNGENGDGIPSNFAPVDSAIAGLGNSSGRLENGNAIRFSAWIRSDPNDPVSIAPQIEPVFKLEFWEFALSGLADFTGGVDNPSFGDRIFDTDQNGTPTTIPDASQRAQWVDLDGDGATSFGNPVSATAVTGAWTLVEHTYVIDDSTWGINGEGGFVSKSIADVEELRPVVFFGDFASTDLTGGGSHWFDNVLVEVFADEAALLATPNTNPDPILSEVASLDGDYNDDASVDQGDLDLVLLNWGDDASVDGVPAGWVNQQPTGLIGQTELDGVLLNWGSTAEATGSAVPEPATAALLALGGVALLRRRSA